MKEIYKKDFENFRKQVCNDLNKMQNRLLENAVQSQDKFGNGHIIVLNQSTKQIDM